MRVSVGLNVEQTQKLIMTPELRQAIVILQLSTLELADYVEQAVLENPLLELRDDGEEKDTLAEPEKNGDIDWEEYFQDTSDLGYVRSPREERVERSRESYLSLSPTLYDHLQWQLQVTPCSQAERAIGEFLIGNIDDNGYLRLSVQEAASILHTSPHLVQRALRLIQSFDPPGVGARDLGECLRLQLERQGKINSKFARILKFHLPDLAAGRLGRIARALEIDVSEVQKLTDVIRSLDPKPGRIFGGGREVRYVVPDVIIEKVDGQYIVTVNDSSMPRLGINPLYQSLLGRDTACDPETKKFIEGKLNAAAWMIRSIEQRRFTLYQVACCLVEVQYDFLERGIKYLHPLTLRDVAEALGMHESTISRATANKYVQTPQGIFEFKFFFANGVNKVQGFGGTATESIKYIIREAISQEDQAAPLTDQQLVDLLRQRGIRVARRTVAKYRDELGILAAAKRKRY